MAEGLLGAGLDPGLSQLLTMLAGGMSGGGLLGGGSDSGPRYSPLNSVAGFGQFQGGSFSALLAGLGPMAQSMGGIGDMVGFSAFPGVMSRLQSPGADPLMLQRQQLMMRQMSRFQFSNGAQIAKGLGLDPDSMLGQTVAGASPILMAMSPEFQQVAAAVTPNILTQSGVQSMMSAAMLTDPTGRFRPQSVEALDRARTRLSITDKGFTDTRVTAGANQTDFAGYIEYAADMDMVDIDMDRTQRREEHRRRISREKYKKDFDELSGDERSMVTGLAQVETEADALAVGGSYAARIGRSVRNTFGVGADQSKVIMQQLGLSASSNAETSGIEKYMQNLEALSKATGATAANVLNLGRAIQAQTGGDALFANQVAATSLLVNRFAQRDAAARRLDVNDTMVQVSANEVLEAHKAMMGAGGQEAIVKIRMFGNEEDNARLTAAQRQAAAGDGAALSAITYEVGRGETALGKRTYLKQLSDARIAAGMNNEMKTSAAAGIDLVKAMDVGFMNDPAFMNQRAVQILNSLSKSAKHAFLMGDKGVGKREDVLKSGVTEEQYDAMMDYFHGSAMEGSQGETFLALASSVDALDENDTVIQDTKRIREGSNKMQDALGAAGANQGVIPNLRAGQIHNMSDVLTSMGWMVPKEMDSFIKNYSQDDQDRMIAAARDRAEAAEALEKDPKDDAAGQKMTSALQSLADFGIGQADPNNVPAEKKAAPAQDSPNSIAPSSTNGTDTFMRQMSIPLLDPEAKKRFEEQEKAVMRSSDTSNSPLRDTSKPAGETVTRLEIDMKINGEKIQSTNFTAKGSMPHGFRGSVNGVEVPGQP